jgi:chromosome partitioning protein
MAIIAVLNSQPGVGTTTTALNLLAAIAQRGRRPLAIDFDPRGDLTRAFGTHPDSADDSVCSFFARGQPLGDIAQISRSGVVVCPAHPDLADLDARLGKGIDVVTRLRRALCKPNAATGPVVIDCGPHLGVLALNAIFACDRLIVPVSADPLALDGAERVERTTAALERVRKHALPRHYVRTRCTDSVPADADGLAGRLAGRVPASSICAARIRECDELAQALAAGLDIFRHAPESPGAEDYLALIDELVGAGLDA